VDIVTVENARFLNRDVTGHSDQLDPHQVGQYEVVLVVAATAINVAGSSSVYRAECQPGMYDYQDHL
jgi:hypothetical protein